MNRRSQRNALRLVIALGLACTPIAAAQETAPAESASSAVSDLGKTSVVEFSTESPPPSATDWWLNQADSPLLGSTNWVSFDLPTVLVDTIVSSPRIEAVRQESHIALEKIVQQSAAFDSRLVLEGGYGLTNDPVGNTLVTGGPPRLRERSFTFNGGVRRSGRSGTTVDLSQELGLLNSNSQFFVPLDQGNSRLSLSLTQPLMAGGGRVYNERLLVQARIDNRVAWEDMRADVGDRIAEVMTTYVRLHQQRCQLVQQDDLLRRGDRIGQLIAGRRGFDVGRLAMVKLQQRTSSRNDTRLQLIASILQLQSELKVLIGSETLATAAEQTEFIPLTPIEFPHEANMLGDALRTGMQHRPKIRAAIEDLQSAALGIRVTKNQLLPRLDAVLNGYLAGLNGNNAVFQSFGDQFWQSGPGISAALQYELPQGNRYAKSRHREALHRFRKMSSELQELIQQVRLEIETALIRMQMADQFRVSKRRTLQAAIDEEAILTERYDLVGAEGSHAGLVLENLLEAQQRRTDAEKALVAAIAEYRIALIELQRSMGTLLIREGIRPVRGGSSRRIDFVHSLPTDASEPMVFGDENFHVVEDSEDLFESREQDADEPAISLGMSHSPDSPTRDEFELIEADPPSSATPNISTSGGDARRPTDEHSLRWFLRRNEPEVPPTGDGT